MVDHKESIAKMQEFANEHLVECCAELLHWHKESILPDGKVRELAALCTFDEYNRLTQAERMIELAALERVARTPAMRLSAEAMDAADCKHDYRETADDRLPSSWIDVCAKCGHERGTIYTTTPPAPAQAAPQEGEGAAERLYMAHAQAHPRAGRVPPWRELAEWERAPWIKAARPSACALGAWNDAIEAAASEAEHWQARSGSTHKCGDYIAGAIRTMKRAALQHRGDSRVGEASGG